MLSEKDKNKRSVVLLSVICVFLVGICIVEFFVYNSSGPARNSSNDIRWVRLYDVEVHDGNESEFKLAMKNRADYIKHALEIKDFIRPVALAHKSFLLALKSTDSKKWEEMKKVRGIIPEVPPQFVSDYRFTWQHDDPFAGPKNFMDATLEKQMNFRLEKQFSVFHDYPVSMSMSGANMITVWISGRITETYGWKVSQASLHIEPSVVMGRNVSDSELKDVYDGKAIELHPPFEFLR